MTIQYVNGDLPILANPGCQNRRWASISYCGWRPSSGSKTTRRSTPFQW